MRDDDPFDDIETLRLSPDQLRTVTPKKILKRRGHFIGVPFNWLERLNGASGKTYSLALHLLYRHWKAKGRPFAVANGMLQIDGISPTSKLRALAELEARGLVSVERRPLKSPIVTVHV